MHAWKTSTAFSLKHPELETQNKEMEEDKIQNNRFLELLTILFIAILMILLYVKILFF